MGGRPTCKWFRTFVGIKGEGAFDSSHVTTLRYSKGEGEKREGDRLRRGAGDLMCMQAGKEKDSSKRKGKLALC